MSQLHVAKFAAVIMKVALQVLVVVLAGSLPSVLCQSNVIDDLDVISQHWGQITPYKDNKPDYFGVESVGLPDGCGIEQVHVLHRFVISPNS